jgi:hypothetical protein
MLKPSSPLPPDDVDTGWDESDSVPSARAAAELVHGHSGASADLDDGWDDVAAVPESSAESPLSSPGLDSVDAGWDEDEASGGPQPERELGLRAERALARSGGRQVPSGAKAASLTKKERRELERRRRTQTAELKSERKQQKKQARQEQQRLLVEQRRAEQQRLAAEAALRRAQKIHAKPVERAANEKRTAARGGSSSRSELELPHPVRSKISTREAEPRAASKAPRASSTRSTSKRSRKSAADQSNFGRIALLVLFGVLVAAVIFAFTR